MFVKLAGYSVRKFGQIQFSNRDAHFHIYPASAKVTWSPKDNIQSLRTCTIQTLVSLPEIPKIIPVDPSTLQKAARHKQKCARKQRATNAVRGLPRNIVMAIIDTNVHRQAVMVGMR